MAALGLLNSKVKPYGTRSSDRHSEPGHVRYKAVHGTLPQGEYSERQQSYVFCTVEKHRTSRRTRTRTPTLTLTRTLRVAHCAHRGGRATHASPTLRPSSPPSPPSSNSSSNSCCCCCHSCCCLMSTSCCTRQKADSANEPESAAVSSSSRSNCAVSAEGQVQCGKYSER